MKKTAYRFLIIAIILVSNHLQLSSQNTKVMNLKLEAGYTYLHDVSGDADSQNGPFLSASLRLKKHELYIGSLLGWMGTDHPNPGAIAGYRYYFFKDPSRINMFLHYDFRYFRESGKFRGIADFNYYFDYYDNVIGYGFNVELDKKGLCSFYTTLGYAVLFFHIKSEIEKNTEKSWKMIDVSSGFSFKLAKFGRKDKKE